MIDKFYLHDSLITKVEHLIEEKKVVFHIILNNWMQDGYIEGVDPEFVNMDMVFSGVVYYETNMNSNYIFHYNEILNINVVGVDDNEVKVVFMDEIDTDVGIITVRYDRVEWNDLGPAKPL